jgi:predicted O-linked N-acetylglucosamine transferase (SPINDLY family)
LKLWHSLRPGSATPPGEAAERLIAEGNRVEQEGDLHEACNLYREAVHIAPGYAKAHLNLGIGLEAAGEGDAAAAAFEAALRIDPTDPYTSYNLGRLLHVRGELPRAEQLLRAALERKPDFPEAQVVLATVYDSQGKFAAAASALEQALRQRPDYPEALLTYGIVLSKLARWADAEAALRRAFAAGITDADAHYWLGNALAGQENLAEARSCYLKAIELRPDYAEAWCNLGNVHVDWGLLDDAQRCLTKALEIRPDLPNALCGLGNLHFAAKRIEDAADYYRKAIALDPGTPDPHVNLGHVFKSQGRAQEELACYRAALALKPDFVGARWALAMSRIQGVPETNDEPERGRAAFETDLEGLEEWLDATRSAEGSRAVGVQQPFSLAYQEENNRNLLERYGRLCARLMAHWQNQQGLRPAGRRRPGPIRIGIVCRYFYEHSVWNAIVKGWFQQLDHGRLALQAFCLGPEQDTETLYARSRAARFEQGAGGLRQWLEAILDAQPDVLLYPEIGMDPLTVKLASMRVAPVQVTTWGHPETSGLPTIDYYLSGEDFEPAGAQANYTERLVALPHLSSFVQPAKIEAVSPDLDKWGVDARTPLLICPGTPFKYAPQHDAIFPEIARRLGRCRFIFFTPGQAVALCEKLRRRLRAAFDRSGLGFDEFVTFIPWLSKGEFYGLLQRADVYLDTLGFSGFNTALQAVECGLPIVTREGRFLRGRLASGILKCMGLSDLVAPSAEEYIRLAVSLARDAEYREVVRARIRASRHVLFEDLAPIRALEAFLVQVASVPAA